MAGNEDLLSKLATAADPVHMNFDRCDQIKRQLEVLKSTRTKGVSTKSITVIGRAPNRSFGIIPLSKQNMVSMEDILQLGPDFVHQGKFLLCRSIMPAAESEEMTILVDDPSGRLCSRLSLANFPSTVRPGTILAIFHPWYDSISQAIRLENPLHVRVVDWDDELVKDIQWEILPQESGVVDQKQIDDPANLGNVYFADKNYHKAVEAYSKAILRNPQNPTLYSNRAVAYLKMENPHLALQDTENGLMIRPSNVKLLIRKAKALIQMKRYEEAAEFLEKAREDNKEAMKDRSFATLTTASKRMVDEVKNGHYDIFGMMEEAQRSKILENHAEYVAWGKFQIEEIDGKGRGLVAKEEIKTGTLLMVKKAFVYAHLSECSSTAINWSTKTPERSTFGPLVRKVCAKIFNNPELGGDFYTMYAGNKLGWLEKTGQSNTIDIDRISAVVRHNTFSDEDGLIEDTKFRTVSDLCGGGLWESGAFLNHSCVDFNIFYFVVGDFLFVRSIKKIQKGDELVINYISNRLPLNERSSYLARFDFKCTCKLCQIDRNDKKAVQDRMNAIRQFLKGLDFTKEFIPKDGVWKIACLKRMVNEVEDLREDMSINFLLEDVQRALGLVMIVEDSGWKDDAMELFTKVYENWYKSDDIHAAFSLAQSLALLAFQQWKDSRKWIGIAHRLGNLLYGDGRVMKRLEFAYKLKIDFL